MHQWLIVWQGCVTVLRDNALHVPNPVVTVGVEVTDTGNLDDIVLRRITPPHTYGQVKYAVDSTSPVNADYLLKPSSSKGPSILSKIASAWKELTSDGSPVDLVLISNRVPDASDPLVSLRDSRSGLLVPKAGRGSAKSTIGLARARWAVSAGLDEDELSELLKVLRFDLGRDPTHLHELVSLQMLAAGLRHDDNAVHAAADWIARQVRDGHRHLDRAAIEQAVDDLGLRAGPARAVLSIATLKPDPLAVDADYALDWVERFDGDSAYLKRRPRAPATWDQLQTEIESVPSRLRTGRSAVLLTGSLRQATAFAIGGALRMVSGIDIAVNQRGQLWSSREPYNAPLTPRITEHVVGRGNELAMALAVATDLTEDVLEFVHKRELPVERLLVLRPPAGAKDNAVPDAAAAVALAVGVRDTVRQACRNNPRVHLFLAGPMGLALLLGHRWNRVKPTVVYEDVQNALVYEAAFTLDA
ncbi:MAG: SAVED domain-containing protein [Pseudonocardiaceae bacterium]